MWPAAIGCVPWLTSEAVVDRLVKLNSCCVVIDKGASRHALGEMTAQGFPNAAITRLEGMMPATVDGDAPFIIGPYTRGKQRGTKLRRYVSPEIGKITNQRWNQIGAMLEICGSAWDGAYLPG